MRNAIFALAVLALAATASAADSVQDRLVDLPELGNRWYLTVVITDPPTQDDILFLKFMSENKSMLGLRSQVAYNEWSNARPIVSQTDWSKFLGESRPAILLQSAPAADGKADVVFFAQGKIDTDSLPKQINDAIAVYAARQQGPFEPWRRPCPDGRCPLNPLPRPFPKPEPPPVTPPVTPPPAVTPLVPTVPVVPEVPKEEGGIPLWAFLLPILGGLGGGLYSSFKQ